MFIYIAIFSCPRNSNIVNNRYIVCLHVILIPLFSILTSTRVFRVSGDGEWVNIVKFTFKVSRTREVKENEEKQADRQGSRVSKYTRRHSNICTTRGPHGENHNYGNHSCGVRILLDLFQQLLFGIVLLHTDFVIISIKDL